jgi:hypothetical protein
LSIYFDLDFVINPREISKMVWKNYSNHNRSLLQDLRLD